MIPPDPLVQTFLEPFATSETAISSVLAVMLHQPAVLDAFLDEVWIAGTDRPGVHATIQKLRRDPSPEILVEPFMANAGNLDLVIQSRKENAILAVENKTISQLGARQLTKYRLVLRDSDPTGGSRSFATALLRPPRRASPGSDADERRDPAGFQASAILSYGMVPRLLEAAGDRWSPPAFFGRTAMDRLAELAQGPARAHGRTSTPIANRAKQLQEVAARVEAMPGWQVDEPTQTTLRVAPPADVAPWTIKLGGGATSCLNVALGRELGSRQLREQPTRLVHLAGGYRSISIPTPFPSRDRPWSDRRAATGKVDEARMVAQAAVAARILRHAHELLHGNG